MKDAIGWQPADYEALVKLAGRMPAPVQEGSVPPEWLAAVMYSESRMRPWKANGLGYRGLIQLGTQELKGMGLSDAQLARFTQLTPAQQMRYVERYYKVWQPAGGWISRAQLYQGTFLPSTIRYKGSDPATVLASKPSDGCPKAHDVFCNNKILSHDGKKITVGDLDQTIEDVLTQTKEGPLEWPVVLEGIRHAKQTASLPGGPVPGIVPVAFATPAPTPAATDSAALLFGGLLLLGGGYWLLNKS